MERITSSDPATGDELRAVRGGVAVSAVPRRPGFKLNLTETRNYPTGADLRRCLSRVEPGVKSFMILERQDGHFMQARLQYDLAWILEWQRGGRGEHFRCSGENLTREIVATAFAGFLEGNAEDVEGLGWTRITL